LPTIAPFRKFEVRSSKFQVAFKKTPEVLAATARGLVFLVLCIALVSGSCRREAPPRHYTLKGQVLAVHPERQQVTIRHEDIDGLMPAMTMTFPVSTKELIAARAPGELVTARLQVAESEGTLVDITRTGMADLPTSANEIALASGIIEVGQALPDAALLDQADRRRSLSEWRGTPVLVTFSYTRCPLPAFCPLMDQNFATIQRTVAEDAVLRGRVRLMSISLDPDHDTPAVLAGHAWRLKADPAVWTFLTGDRVTIDRVSGRFGVGILRNPTSPTDITHNLRTILAGADGKVVKIYTGNEWTTAAVLADLRGILQQ
jgi:protein SCO1